MQKGGGGNDELVDRFSPNSFALLFHLLVGKKQKMNDDIQNLGRGGGGKYFILFTLIGKKRKEKGGRGHSV